MNNLSNKAIKLISPSIVFVVVSSLIFAVYFGSAYGFHENRLINSKSRASAPVRNVITSPPNGGGGSGTSIPLQYFFGGVVPSALAAPSATTIFTISRGLSETGPGYIYDVDPSPYTPPPDNLGVYIKVVSHYDVPTLPTAIAIGVDGNFWVTNSISMDLNGSMVSHISSSSAENSSIPLCTFTDGLMGLDAIAIGPDGNIWVTDEHTNMVMELNHTDCQLMITPNAQMNQSPYHSGVKKMVVACPYCTPEQASYSSGGIAPDAIAISASNIIWVANRGSDNVVELNSLGTILKTFKVGIAPVAIAIGPDGNIWVANEGSNTVTELNPSNGVIGTYTVGKAPDAMAIDHGGNIWITNMMSNSVTEIMPIPGMPSESDTSTLTYSLNQVCTSSPDAIAIDPAGDVWIANTEDNLYSSPCYGDTNLIEMVAVADNGQYFPYSGPMWPGSF